MALAISLKGVNDTADPIRALWEEVARFESRPSMAALNYPPHLTLAVYDDVPPVQVRDALREAFAGRSALRLTFTRLRFFDDPLVLWAEPLPSADLTSAHAKVHALIDPRHCHPHYRPGAWVPPLHAGNADSAQVPRRSPSTCHPFHPDIRGRLRCRRLCFLCTRGRYGRAAALSTRATACILVVEKNVCFIPTGVYGTLFPALTMFRFDATTWIGRRLDAC
jgi:2'-5' RNA ligase